MNCASHYLKQTRGLVSSLLVQIISSLSLKKNLFKVNITDLSLLLLLSRSSRSDLCTKLFLNILQSSLENTCNGVYFLVSQSLQHYNLGDFETGVSLLIL